MSQNYLIIDASNVVVNCVMWDGNPETWEPPADTIQLIKATTPAITWVFNQSTMVWEQQTVMGAGSIGFTWDGTTLTTNQPQPQ